MMRRAIAFVALLLAVPSFGAELSRGVTDVTPILDGQGAARILFKTGAPWEVSNVGIREATLSFATVPPRPIRRIG